MGEILNMVRKVFSARIMHYILIHWIIVDLEMSLDWQVISEYNICSRHDIAEILLKLVLNTNQSNLNLKTISMPTSSYCRNWYSYNYWSADKTDIISAVHPHHQRQ